VALISGSSGILENSVRRKEKRWGKSIGRTISFTAKESRGTGGVKADRVYLGTGRSSREKCSLNLNTKGAGADRSKLCLCKAPSPWKGTLFFDEERKRNSMKVIFCQLPRLNRMGK